MANRSDAELLQDIIDYIKSGEGNTLASGLRLVLNNLVDSKGNIAGGPYIPRAGGSGNAMTGPLYMGGFSMRALSQIQDGGLTLAYDVASRSFYDAAGGIILQLANASLGPIFHNGTASTQMRFLAAVARIVQVQDKDHTLAGLDDIATAAALLQAISQKNQPNGYAGLDGSGKVASAQLPSYVDDVIEVANYAALPVTGETSKIYITLDDNKEYRWSGSAYVFLRASPGTTDDVPESGTPTNKYWTNARSLGTTFTGYVSGAGVITALDTLLQVIQKLDGNDALRELLSNKVNDFLNASITSGKYASTSAITDFIGLDCAWVNSFGADPTGVSDSTTAIQAAYGSGKKNIICNGQYITTATLTLPDNIRFVLLNNSKITANGNSLTTAAITLGNNCHVKMDELAMVARGTGANSYSGFYVNAKYQWSITGGKITGFGNYGVRVSGSASSPNQYRNGFIQNIEIYGLLNNASGTGSTGSGIYLENAAEYVTIVNCNIHDNAGFGVYNNQAGNSAMQGCKIMSNTLGGVRVIGIIASGNTDHFPITNCQVNHNSGYNYWFTDVRYAVTVTGGCSIGGTLVKAENSKNITFNGLLLGIGGANYVDKGANGSDVKVNTGSTMTATQSACVASIVGGGNIGTIVFTNASE